MGWRSNPDNDPDIEADIRYENHQEALADERENVYIEWAENEGLDHLEPETREQYEQGGWR